MEFAWSLLIIDVGSLIVCSIMNFRRKLNGSITPL